MDFHLMFNSRICQALNLLLQLEFLRPLLLLLLLACLLTQSSVQVVKPCVGLLQPAGQRKDSYQM